MNVPDFLRTVADKIVDSMNYSYDFDFYYGMEEWLTVDLAAQKNDFIYVEPIPSVLPETATGFYRESYELGIILGRVIGNKDISKKDQEDAIWSLRPFVLQYIRRMHEEVTDENAKKLLPYDGGARLEEVREFTANNVYGIKCTITIIERFPSESC